MFGISCDCGNGGRCGLRFAVLAIGATGCALLTGACRKDHRITLDQFLTIQEESKQTEAERTQALLDGFNIVDVTRDIAEKAGSYKRTTKSQRLELMDCLIAATAHATRATLATGNIKHYPMPDIETLSVPSR